ncbi:hypothetical protein H920_06915 [Fukomys damarensis]|uniref:Uncharacterized protein n=1 Tax=Fukomys damarensis TaxID=885580 RepID=A0A091E966_FUKDA|nr:hypothetical protein H920_06915 [Fukomys damarensis]
MQPVVWLLAVDDPAPPILEGAEETSGGTSSLTNSLLLTAASRCGLSSAAAVSVCVLHLFIGSALSDPPEAVPSPAWCEVSLRFLTVQHTTLMPGSVCQENN